MIWQSNKQGIKLEWNQKTMKQNEFLAILDASTLPSHVERPKKSNGTVVFTAETSFKVENEDLWQ